MGSACSWIPRPGRCLLYLYRGCGPRRPKGIDPAKPAAASKAKNTQCKVFRRGLDYNINPWCIAGAPVVAWAREVFPGDADEVAIYKLWNAILHTARADGQDPESDWELHDAAFEKNLRFLNDNRFDYLHYTAANGTDLTIGMTKGHEWAGGKGQRRPMGTLSSPTFPPRKSSLRPIACAPTVSCTRPCRSSTTAIKSTIFGLSSRAAAWWTTTPAWAGNARKYHRY